MDTDFIKFFAVFAIFAISTISKKKKWCWRQILTAKELWHRTIKFSFTTRIYIPFANLYSCSCTSQIFYNKHTCMFLQRGLLHKIFSPSFQVLIVFLVLIFFTFISKSVRKKQDRRQSIHKIYCKLKSSSNFYHKFLVYLYSFLQFELYFLIVRQISTTWKINLTHIRRTKLQLVLKINLKSILL